MLLLLPLQFINAVLEVLKELNTVPACQVACKLIDSEIRPLLAFGLLAIIYFFIFYLLEQTQQTVFNV